MKVELVRASTGANVYSHQPVAVINLHLEELKSKNSGVISGFAEHRLQILPGLSTHHCKLKGW